MGDLLFWQFVWFGWCLGVVVVVVLGFFCLFGFACTFICFLKTDLGQANTYPLHSIYFYRGDSLKINEEEAWNFPVCVNKAFSTYSQSMML